MNQIWLDAFIKRAGFHHGWENLDSWARRMAEQAYKEALESHRLHADATAKAQDRASRIQWPDTTGQ